MNASRSISFVRSGALLLDEAACRAVRPMKVGKCA